MKQKVKTFFGICLYIVFLISFGSLYQLRFFFPILLASIDESKSKVYPKMFIAGKVILLLSVISVLALMNWYILFYPVIKLIFGW